MTTTRAAARTMLMWRWERATEWPLMIAAIVFLATYAVPILDPDLPTPLVDLCGWLSWITWAIFVIDFVVRLALADERVRYLIRHWYDVLVLALPLLRPLRTPADSAAVGAEPTRQGHVARPCRRLHRRRRISAGLLRSPGRARCRTIQPGCQHH